MEFYFTNDVEHTGMNGRTWERIAQQVDEVTLPMLLDLYDKYNVKSTFFVLGQIVEMRGLSREQCILRMNACELFALPSHSEGSPQALKEAMACNCPCLATDIADVRELFGDEPGHWILRNPRKTHERWDGDEQSLDEMVELLKEALAFEGRTNGRQRLLELELSNEQVALRIIKIYKQVLEKK